MSEEEEMGRVLREIADAMRARGAALTLHPEDGSTPEILFCDNEGGIGRSVIAGLLEEAKLWPKSDPGEIHRWVACDIEGVPHQAMSMPVNRVPGHSRLVISVYFDDPTPARLHEAERVYLSRRPFAIGYFRLWQHDRVLGHRVDALEAALNLSDFGVVLLDRSGEIAFANDAARIIFAAGDGLREKGGKLTATELNDSVRLRVAIDHVIAADGAAERTNAPILKLARKHGLPLIVSVLPNQRPATEAGHVAAVLYVLDPSLDLTQLLGPVCKLYQLSNAETALVCQLVAGATLLEAAQAMRIKEPTARTYLKNAFGKTDTNRQADLIRLMLSNVIRTSRSISHLVF